MALNPQKLKILAFAAHPDDAELACSGTLIKEAKAGHAVGIVDLTTGDLGTRGTSEIRLQEAKASAEILGLSVRENLFMPDGFFEETQENLIKVITALRTYQPDIVLANAIEDRHPDHGRASALVSRACFLSGLARIETGQERWRPKSVYHYIQFRYIKPDFVVDVTDEWEVRMEAVRAFKSQFYDPRSDEPSTMIASEAFMKFIEARGREMGGVIERPFGEGYTVERTPEVHSLTDLF
ncbi:MAG: bacillithiol biosynthesis deacetylase BshB1 [Flavobacteriales bacterium]|nr:bacillithiol biosynthesis deacetylase BshB1 [Bacteroidota bacterium]MCB9240546.1 bacillithiol biosynthesis deacetylase BshB1 [Flavobacteriales bacterium]